MRNRQKFTAGGALLLAGMAIGGGVMVTSQAMAGDEEAIRGTLTVVAVANGDAEAVRCTYDDVTFPAGPMLSTSSASTAALGTAPASVSVISGTATAIPIDAGAVLVQSGTLETVGAGGATSVGGVAPGVLPELTPGAWAGGGPLPANVVAAGVAVAADVPPDVLLSGVDARPGTAAECAEMRPVISRTPAADAGAVDMTLDTVDESASGG